MLTASLSSCLWFDVGHDAFLCTVITPELKSSLVKVLGLLKDAAESFSKVHRLLHQFTSD